MSEATDELRERLAKALHEAQCGCPTWVVKDLEDTQYDDMAAAIMPLVVAVVAEARTEAVIVAQSAIEFIQERDSGLAIDLDEHFAQKFGAPDRELLQRVVALRASGLAGSPDPSHPESPENDPGRYGY